MNSDWPKEFFSSETVLDLWRKAVPPAATQADVDFLEQMLGARTRLLDVPSGSGRHSLELARRGCRVTGVDIAPSFIREAQAQAQAGGLSAEFILGDMRELNYEAEFDGAFCFGNSFGYCEHAQLTTFAAAVARALKPGGKFALDTGMTAESLLPNFRARHWLQVDDILFTIENRYLAAESCLETEGTFIRNGQVEKKTWWHWVYSVAELRRLLRGAGLETLHLFSGPDRQPFQLGSPRLLLVAEKRG